jgi:hypothetical protein
MKALQLITLAAIVIAATQPVKAQSQNEMVKVSIIHHDGTSMKRCDTIFSANGNFKLDDYYRLKGIDPAQVQTVNVNGMNNILPADHKVAVWMMDHSTMDKVEISAEGQDERGKVVIVKRLNGGADTVITSAGNRKIMIVETSETSDAALLDAQEHLEMAEKMRNEAMQWHQKAANEEGMDYKNVEVQKTIDANGTEQVKVWVNGVEVDPASVDIEYDTQNFVIETEEFEGDENNKVVVVRKGQVISDEAIEKLEVAQFHEAQAQRAFTLALVSRIKAEEAQKLNTVMQSENEVRDLQFFPNPAAGKFRLSFELPEGGATAIRIYNMEGKEVYAENLVNFSGRYDNEIDVSKFTPGTYILNILRDGTRIAEKLIVQ